MAGQPSWKGPITFGLVSVPVKLYKGTDEKNLSFKQVHICTDEEGNVLGHSRIKYLKVCEGCEEELSGSDISKGYPYGEKMITFGPHELDALALTSTKAIEVIACIPREKLDFRQINGIALLGPEDAAAKPYALMRIAMKKQGVVGIGKLVSRGRERVIALIPQEGHILAATLFWPDEVRPLNYAPVPGATLTDKEMDLGERLIQSITEPEMPELEDNYRQAVEDIVASKALGVDMEIPELAAPEPAGDLVASLMASLGEK